MTAVLADHPKPRRFQRRSEFAQRYEVLSGLGAGAFGVALMARRKADGLPVAVKVLATAAMSRRDRKLVSE